MPGSVPFGIQENDTRSSIRRKKGSSGAVATAFVGKSFLTGTSAACAKLIGISATADNAVVATARQERSIQSPPDLLIKRLRQLTPVMNVQISFRVERPPAPND